MIQLPNMPDDGAAPTATLDELLASGALTPEEHAQALARQQETSTSNDAAIAIALTTNEANANNAHNAHDAAARESNKEFRKCVQFIVSVFVFWAIVLGPLLAMATLLATASNSYEGIGAVYLNSDTAERLDAPERVGRDKDLGIADGVRFAGVSTTGAVSLCTRVSWETCRKYKKGQRCTTHTNAVFGSRNCTTVEAGVAGCGDDLPAAAEKGRQLGLGFGVPAVLAEAALLVGTPWWRRWVKQPQDRRGTAVNVLLVGLFPFTALGTWLTWGTQHGTLSLPVCTSITAFLSNNNTAAIPNGTTYDALGFFAADPGPFVFGAAIWVVVATLLLLLYRKTFL
jgi:hypothetical protein